MRPDDEVRVNHLLDAARKAIAYTDGRTREDLDTDQMLRLALTKLVEIVGEAAKQVSAASRAAHSRTDSGDSGADVTQPDT